MKSTGEVLGIGNNLEEALYKGLIASGSKMNKNGGVFITVRDGDKKEIGEIAKKFDKMGFPPHATTGTASVLAKLGLSVKIVDKIHESPVNTITLLESGKLAYIISTSAKGRNPARDSVKIRRKAALLGIPCLTSDRYRKRACGQPDEPLHPYNTEIVDINNPKSEKVRLPFTKMSACSNDYIYINCFENEVSSGIPLDLPLRPPQRRRRRWRDFDLPLRQGGCADAHVQPRRQRGHDVRQRHPLRREIPL